MKIIKSTLFVVSILSVLLFSSCSEDEQRTGVTLGAITTGGTVTTKTGRTSGTNDLSFTSGSITIREVIFDGENGSNSISRTVEQVATIDYETEVVSPEMFIDIPAGDYTSVNLGIELQDINSTPAIVLEGTYTNSNDEVFPIRFDFNSGEVFEANASSVSIPAGVNLIGKITFDALDWFSPISASQLDNCDLTEGTIVISSSSNTTIYDIVADRLDVGTQAIFE